MTRARPAKRVQELGIPNPELKRLSSGITHRPGVRGALPNQHESRRKNVYCHYLWMP